jgi:peptide/nickel transport system substrate-binding protein
LLVAVMSMLIAVGALALAAALGGTPASRAVARAGGTLRVASPVGPRLLDPALARPIASRLLVGTCATLMTAGNPLRLEAAAGPPQVTRDRRTYVFTVRRGLHFSDGSPLNAENFAVGLRRVLDPRMLAEAASIYSDITRIAATGRRLRIELRRPSGDLPARLTRPFACPVPLGFPVDPAGVDLMVGSGPYYVAQHEPGLFVLERNRYYRGPRPQRIDRLVYTIGGELADTIRAVEEERADVLWAEIPSDVRVGLVRRYGINGRQMFRRRGTFVGALVLNTSRPLFRNNRPLREAVNLALDRPELVRQFPGGRLFRPPSDQILSRAMPGWVDHKLYPLDGPNLRLARSLAAGNLRNRNAVLYVSPTGTAGIGFPDVPNTIVANLTRIGLRVEVKAFADEVLNAKAGVPREAYDMLFADFWPQYPDPAAQIIGQLGGENARKPFGNTNFAYFDKPAYNRRMAAANALAGKTRYRAFSKLEADILRNEAPWAPIYEGNSWQFVSKRVGCVEFQGTDRIVLMLAYWAICLR